MFSEDTGKRDAAWVEATLAGDAQAFGQLVETYERRAVGTAYRLLGFDEHSTILDQQNRPHPISGDGRFRPELLR